jgi:hypothetical protein
VDSAGGHRPFPATVLGMTAMPRPDVPVRTPAELTDWWARLLEPPVFRRRDLWVAWLDADGRVLPTVLPFEDLPLAPDRALLSGLVELHTTIAGEFLGDGGHLALCLCRPGGSAVREDDDIWADALRAVLDGRWSLHLAAGRSVTPLVEPPDVVPTR